MDRLGRNRLTKPFAWFLLYLMPVAAAIGLYLFLTEFAVLISSRGPALSNAIRSYGPLINLGLPGINPYLPIVDGWIALMIGIILHEGAHGVIARSMGLPVKSSGMVFVLFVPIAAFVEVDDEAVKLAKPSVSMRMLAGGAGINLVIAAVCLVLLVGTVSTMVPLATGAGIVAVGPGTPAANAGLRAGDIVTALDGKSITDLNTVLGQNTTLHAGDKINLTVVRGGETHQFNNIALACCDSLVDTRTNKTLKTWPYIGVNSASESDLEATVSGYTNLVGSFRDYVCVPTIPACQGVAPFSDSMSVFYRSSVGIPAASIATLLYWIFFLNLNLSIFNALPIYPLDGGQAFKVAVTALLGKRGDEKTAMRITTGVSLLLVGLIFAVVLGPYIYLL
jgi:membrane-associated protease RseP (regulator of RpoE activity)